MTIDIAVNPQSHTDAPRGRAATAEAQAADGFAGLFAGLAASPQTATQDRAPRLDTPVPTPPDEARAERPELPIWPGLIQGLLPASKAAQGDRPAVTAPAAGAAAPAASTLWERRESRTAGAAEAPAARLWERGESRTAGLPDAAEVPALPASAAPPAAPQTAAAADLAVRQPVPDDMAVDAPAWRAETGPAPDEPAQPELATAGTAAAPAEPATSDLAVPNPAALAPLPATAAGALAPAALAAAAAAPQAAARPGAQVPQPAATDKPVRGPAARAAGPSISLQLPEQAAAQQATAEPGPHPAEPALRTERPAPPIDSARPLAGGADALLLSTAPAVSAAARGADSTLPMATPSQPVPADQLSQHAVAIIRQLGEGRSHAHIELHPAELGHLDLELRQDGQKLEIHVAVDNEQSRRLVQDQLAQWRERLAESGIALQRLDVELREREPAPRQDSDGRNERAAQGVEEGVNNPASQWIRDPSRTLDLYA